MTRDELVEALRLHRGEIVEADEWRPLADHVLELVNYGNLRPAAIENAEIDRARAFVEEQRKVVAGFSILRQTGTVLMTLLRALDALAREPGLRSDLERLTELRDGAEAHIQKMQETIDGMNAGTVKPVPLETCLKVIELEEREARVRALANEFHLLAQKPHDGGPDLRLMSEGFAQRIDAALDGKDPA